MTLSNRAIFGPIVRAEWPRMVLGAVMIIISRCAAFAVPISARFIVDQVAVARRVDRLLPICALVIASGVIQAMCGAYATMTVTVAGHRWVALLRQKLHGHVLRLSLLYFDEHRVGTICSRIIRDVDGVRHLMGIPLLEFAGGCVTAIVSITYLSSVDSLLGGVICVGLLGVSVGASVNLRRVRRAAVASAVAEGHLAGRLNESVAGIRVVKGYRAEHNEERLVGEFVQRMQRVAIDSTKAVSRLGAHNTLFTTALSTLIMLAAGHEVLSNRLTVGEVATYLVMLPYLVVPIIQIQSIGPQIGEAISSLARTSEILSLPTEDETPGRDTSLYGVAGKISFDSVDFSYGDGTPVLSNVSFEAMPGMMTALVGTSGSGKSTILALIAAFYTAKSGVVRIDGIDISRVTLDSLRSQQAIVPQDTFLFDGTIRENILFGDSSATSEEFDLSCHSAYVNEFVRRLPRQYETVVGERGIKLSAGQRQRIAIARAILANPPILLFDEATSNLDTESEAMIRRGLAALARNRTTVVIAHRLSTIRSADQILVVEGGTVIEKGSHDMLYSSRGRYYDLYRAQESGAEV